MNDDMIINGPRNEPITSFEDWANIFTSSKKARHWKRYRSAYSLAEFIMQENGLEQIQRRVSRAIGSQVKFERAIIEHEVRFDSYGHGREHDLGVFGRTDSGNTVYVGVEAKVDEPFGQTVIDAYIDSKSRELSGISTNAPLRIEQLLQYNFKQVDRHKFGLRYQLLYSTAGTLAAGADVSVLYIASFKTPLYDELIGADNFRDYMAFMKHAGGRELAVSSHGSDMREVEVGGAKLLCIYNHIQLTTE